MSVTAVQQFESSSPVQFGQRILGIIRSFNIYAITSALLSFLFILYFFIPRSGMLRYALSFSVLYIIFVPLFSFILSIFSLRQIARTRERGAVLSYCALAITSLYLMVALAIPVVLFCLYMIYTYVL